jgi:hypothetical protein
LATAFGALPVVQRGGLFRNDFSSIIPPRLILARCLPLRWRIEAKAFLKDLMVVWPGSWRSLDS